MPYVNESRKRKGPDIEVKDLTNGIVTGIFPWNDECPSESQYGFRSGPLSKEELFMISRLDKDGTWANKAQQINALDRLATASSPQPVVDTRYAPVHERRFYSKNAPASKVYYRNDILSPYPSTRILRGAIRCEPASTALGYRTSPTRVQYQAKATQLMRHMRPSKPDFELARFVGELRHLPRLQELLHFQAFKPGSAGGTYLGYQFGVAPTYSDVMKAAEMVVESDKIIRTFAEMAKARVSRRRKLQISSDQQKASSTLGCGLQGNVDIGGVAVARSLGFTDSYVFFVDTILGYNRELRVFADFEFYVADPYGMTNRLDSYMSNAQKLLGSGLSPHTVWKLTPWTWMSDWFLDIGSLLGYQQDVADNGLVASRSGYTIEDTYTAEMNLRNARTGTWSNTLLGKSSATCVETRQWRYSGSPYDMAFNWSLSGFQTAILAALGISKMNGLKQILP